MKWRTYLIYLVAFLLASCSVQYNLQSHSESIYDVKAENDSTITAMIAPYKIGIDSVMNKVLCVSNIEMTKGKPESLLGNFICDLCLQQYSNMADICVMNNGGLRSTLPQGEVTKRMIFELMPFENELVVLELNKTDFIGLLKHITSSGGEPFSGINISMTNKGELIDYSAPFDFDKEEKVSIITSDYLANKLLFFKDKKQQKVGIKLRDAIIDYCSKTDTITVSLDGRIQIIENGE